jgi:hypothetical protein
MRALAKLIMVSIILLKILIRIPKLEITATTGKKKKKKLKKTGFLNLSILKTWGQIVHCCDVLSCAL